MVLEDCKEQAHNQLVHTGTVRRLEAFVDNGKLGAWFLVFITFAAFALSGCSIRPPRESLETRPAPLLRLIDSGTELLVSRALSVAVDSGMGDCPGDTCLVLSTAYVYYPGFSHESLTPAALPRSDSTTFVLVSPDDINELRAAYNHLEYIQISRVAMSSEEATVDVSFWSTSYRGLGGASGPSLLFRRVDGDWAFVEVKGWIDIN
jgi:hypothetical protein